MKITTKLTWIRMKTYRTRTVVTVIGIILSTAMIAAVTTFLTSSVGFVRDVRISRTGDWHGRAVGLPSETIQKIRENPEIKTATVMQDEGLIPLKQYDKQDQLNLGREYLYLQGLESGAGRILPIHLTDGRFPESSQEVLVSDRLYEAMPQEFRTGSTVTWKIGRITVGGKPAANGNEWTEEGIEMRSEESGMPSIDFHPEQTRTFRITGHYNDDMYDIAKTNGVGYPVFTRADSRTDGGMADIYYQLKRPGRIFSFIQENGLPNDYNSNLLLTMGITRMDSTLKGLYGMVAVVTGIIIFGSFALIGNAFSIGITERSREFGLLSW